jgi:hypothetical protein
MSHNDWLPGVVWGIIFAMHVLMFLEMNYR